MGLASPRRHSYLANGVPCGQAAAPWNEGSRPRRAHRRGRSSGEETTIVVERSGAAGGQPAASHQAIAEQASEGSHRDRGGLRHGRTGNVAELRGG
jgi:hypothetical protein